jgi:hypothetical protein
MRHTRVGIYELAGWGFDREADRSLLSREALQSRAEQAALIVDERAPYIADSPCLEPILQPDRIDAVIRSGEFNGLDWKLAFVNLEFLIAFQRRLGFEEGKQIRIPDPDDSEGLLDLAIPTRGRTSNPFIEVARYRDRWFLRDGYHRSFLLRRHGIRNVPAVVIETRTLEELGAIGHKFFPEEILFSERPPMVCDFLKESLTIRYVRYESSTAAPEPALAGFHHQEGI